MYATRQIYDHAQATIAVPPELQHRCIEVIFIAQDTPPTTSKSSTGQALIDVLRASPYPSLQLLLAT